MEGLEVVTQGYREKVVEPIVIPPTPTTTSRRGGRTERSKKARFVNELGVRVVEVRLKQYREILSIVDVRSSLLLLLPSLSLSLRHFVTSTAHSPDRRADESCYNADRNRTESPPTYRKQRSITRFVPPLPSPSYPIPKHHIVSKSKRPFSNSKSTQFSRLIPQALNLYPLHLNLRKINPRPQDRWTFIESRDCSKGFPPRRIEYSCGFYCGFWGG